MIHNHSGEYLETAAIETDMIAMQLIRRVVNGNDDNVKDTAKVDELDPVIRTWCKKLQDQLLSFKWTWWTKPAPNRQQSQIDPRPTGTLQTLCQDGEGHPLNIAAPSAPGPASEPQENPHGISKTMAAASQELQFPAHADMATPLRPVLALQDVISEIPTAPTKTPPDTAASACSEQPSSWLVPELMLDESHSLAQEFRSSILPYSDRFAARQKFDVKIEEGGITYPSDTRDPQQMHRKHPYRTTGKSTRDGSEPNKLTEQNQTAAYKCCLRIRPLLDNIPAGFTLVGGFVEVDGRCYGLTVCHIFTDGLQAAYKIGGSDEIQKLSEPGKTAQIVVHSFVGNREPPDRPLIFVASGIRLSRSPKKIDPKNTGTDEILQYVMDWALVDMGYESRIQEPNSYTDTQIEGPDSTLPKKVTKTAPHGRKAVHILIDDIKVTLQVDNVCLLKSPDEEREHDRNIHTISHEGTDTADPETAANIDILREKGEMLQRRNRKCSGGSLRE
ncbi:hypothetical protein BDD12DRAFT_903278 [Trichophaea hybrida]|nr:hypothetical protein BDD12DRAFT_903278 [Trichophaea hybrida]